MASTKCLMITSIALCLSVASSLRLSERAPVNFFGEEAEIDEMMGEVPFKEEDMKDANARDPTLRPQLEKMLEKLNQPVVYFIGDSLIRNQFEGMCYLIGKNLEIDFDPTVKATGPKSGRGVSRGRAVDASCTNARGTMVNSFVASHSPEVVDLLLQAGAPQPNTIYWDAAMWTANGDTRKLFKSEMYKRSMNDTIDAYIKAAPHAKLVFFLSHCPCAEVNGKKTKKYHDATREIIKEINDMASSVAASRTDGQGRPILLVDGYTLTQGRCDMTDDGRHFNRLILDEDNLLLRALQN